MTLTRGADAAHVLRETAGTGLHSLTLGRFELDPAAAAGPEGPGRGGLIGLLGLRSEGRSVLRLRVLRIETDAETGAETAQKTLDLRFDADRPQRMAVSSDVGRLALGSEVSADRRARGLVCFLPARLITQRSQDNTSSRFEGVPEVGYALEPVAAFPGVHEIAAPEGGGRGDWRLFLDLPAETPCLVEVALGTHRRLVALAGTGLFGEAPRRLALAGDPAGSVLALPVAHPEAELVAGALTSVLLTRGPEGVTLNGVPLFGPGADAGAPLQISARLFVESAPALHAVWPDVAEGALLPVVVKAV